MPSFIRPSATLHLALILAAGWQALAVNDWSIPCTHGECSWDLPPDSGASGSIHIVRLYFCQQPSLFLTLTDCAAHTHSGVLPTRFRTSPRPLAGELLAVTRFPRRKIFSSFARITIPTVTISSKGGWTPSFVCQTVYEIPSLLVG
jgi:hypothetical protein